MSLNEILYLLAAFVTDCRIFQLINVIFHFFIGRGRHERQTLFYFSLHESRHMISDWMKSAHISVYCVWIMCMYAYTHICKQKYHQQKDEIQNKLFINYRYIYEQIQ